MSDAAKVSEFFKLLGVDESCTDEELRKAYLAVARRTHPDKGGDEAEFKKVQKAYEILSDPQQRRIHGLDGSVFGVDRQPPADVDIDVVILLQRLNRYVNHNTAKMPRDPNLSSYTLPNERRQYFGRLTNRIYHSLRDCDAMGGASVNLSSHEVASRTPCAVCGGTKPEETRGPNFFSTTSASSSIFMRQTRSTSDPMLPPVPLRKESPADLPASRPPQTTTVQPPVIVQAASQYQPAIYFVAAPPKPPAEKKTKYTYYAEMTRKKFHSNPSCWALKNAKEFGAQISEFDLVPRKEDGWFYCDICRMDSQG